MLRVVSATDWLPGCAEALNRCMCCLLSHWFSFLLTASSPNPFITRSPGHVFEACQRTGSLTQSHRFSQTNAATEVVRWHKCILPQSVAPFSTIKRRNNSTSASEWSRPLSHLLTELKLTNTKWDDNTTCHFFNFMHGCPASLCCMPIIKSLCIVNKNYLFRCYRLDLQTNSSHVAAPFLTSIKAHRDTSASARLCVRVLV